MQSRSLDQARRLLLAGHLDAAQVNLIPRAVVQEYDLKTFLKQFETVSK